MIDKNGKLFGKINIIDLLVIIFIVVAVAVIGVFVVKNKKSTESQETLIMKFYAEEISDFVAEKLLEGNSLYDDETHVSLGKITNLEINDSVTYGEISDGQYTMVNKQGYKSVIITGELIGTKNDLGAIISGHQYGVGHSMVLRAGDAKIYLRVYDIAKKEEMIKYEENQATKTKELEFEFFANEVEDYVANSIKPGDAIYDASNGVDLGEVSSIEILPAKVYVTRDDGQIIVSEKEGFNSIRIIGKAAGYLNEHKTAIVDKKEYSLSSAFTMRAGNSIVNDAKVTSIKIKE